MAILITAGFSILLLIVMFVFGLYTLRNLHWVALCLLWGAGGYGLSYLIHTQAVVSGLNQAALIIILLPVIQQILAALGVFFVTRWENVNNLVNGAVYGFASGLGYAICKDLEYSVVDLETAALKIFSTTLVLATASGIVGVLASQYYFQRKPRRITTLLAGLSAGIAYTVAFNLLVTNKIGGNILPIAFGIGGITLVGLYLTGQLRKILIQVGVEKKRADGLLEIVIPIGISLTTEKNFPKLLEKMLVEAKLFCNADGGTLYLRKDDQLEFAVVRNDTLNIAMGGITGSEINLAPLPLHDEKGETNHKNIATNAALTGKTINIADAYENKEYDFSGARSFDEQTGYMSVSFLTIPLKNSLGDVQGVLQLINATDVNKKEIIPFDRNLQELMESFSSLASAALEGYIYEQGLQKEIQQLRIEIDEARRAKQVNEITDTQYFKDLLQKAKRFKDDKED